MSRRGTLKSEIRQRRPFRSLSQEAALGLLRTADQVRRYFSQQLAPSGVTQQQYNVLRILRGAGSEGLPTLAIAERMLEHTPGITRLIDRLQAKGLVERERAASDRRRVDCRITVAGLELLAELDPRMDAADDKCLSVLDDDDLETLIELLDRIREGA